MAPSQSVESRISTSYLSLEKYYDPYHLSTSQPLTFGESSQQTFKVCTFLVNVLSNMYEQDGLNAGSPRDFDWQPANACPITRDFKVEDYAFG